MNHCHDCRYCGMDMDMDPYCVNPKVLEKHVYGLSLGSTKIASFCLSPELPLFEPRSVVK